MRKAVTIENQGALCAGDYEIAGDSVTVHWKHFSKTAQLGGVPSQSNQLAKRLLRELVMESPTVEAKNDAPGP